VLWWVVLGFPALVGPACPENRELRADARRLDRRGRVVERGNDEFTGWFRGVRVGDAVPG
jgi:hypothetical protein